MGAVLLSRDRKQDVHVGFLIVQNSSRGSGLRKGGGRGRGGRVSYSIFYGTTSSPRDFKYLLLF